MAGVNTHLIHVLLDLLVGLQKSSLGAYGFRVQGVLAARNSNTPAAKAPLRWVNTDSSNLNELPHCIAARLDWHYPGLVLRVSGLASNFPKLEGGSYHILYITYQLLYSVLSYQSYHIMLCLVSFHCFKRCFFCISLNFFHYVTICHVLLSYIRLYCLALAYMLF